MTALIPRKPEVDVVVELLESGDYDDSASLAKALIKSIATVLSERDGFAVAVGLRSDDLRVGHGMYYGRAEAVTTAKELTEMGLHAYTLPLFAPSRAILPHEEDGGICQCGDPKERHHNIAGCATWRNRVKCECSTYRKAS